MCHAPRTQVVPLKSFTLEELATYSGQDEGRPLLLAIKGTVFDVTKGNQFYGPNGGAMGGGAALRTRCAAPCACSLTSPAPPPAQQQQACTRLLGESARARWR